MSRWQPLALVSIRQVLERTNCPSDWYRWGFARDAVHCGPGFRTCLGGIYGYESGGLSLTQLGDNVLLDVE